MISPMRRLLTATGDPPPDHPLTVEHKRRTDAVYALADDLWDQVIAPLCRRRRYTFMAGMGGWHFTDRNGKQVDDDRLPEDVHDLLHGLEAPNGYTLASCCRDYPKAAS